MISATHVIMTIHPVLVLLPVLGLFVLPCASTNFVNSFTIVANQTVNKTEDCVIDLCPAGEVCSRAIVYEKKKLCFLINCPNNTQNLCGNDTDFNSLLDSIHMDKNQTDEPVLPHQSSDTNSSQSSPDGSSSNFTQSTTSEHLNVTNISISTIPPIFQNISTTIATTNLPTSTPEKATTTKAVPKPATDTTIPTPAVTSTPTTTTTTTTSPKPSPTTTSTTSTSTTVAQTTKPPSSPLPSGTSSSASISPLVPTTPPSIPTTKPLQTSPIPTSSVEKPSPTAPKTSTSPSVVAPTLPKDVPKGGQAIVEVAGDPLTSHLLNTSSLLAVLLFGLLFFVVTVALFLKQAYESYRRKDYTQVDYLINGMYADSGV